MIRKATIANLIFFIAVCYIVTPWFFEKKLLFNELLAVTGFLILAYKRFRIANDKISIFIVLLLSWCGIHAVVSIFRQDSFYYYFRNSVIAYSIFSFFIGFYCLKYLSHFISKIRNILRYYAGIFLFIPLPLVFYERYGVSALFPALFKNARYRLLPIILILMNMVYSVTYSSSTAFMIAAFLFLVFVSMGYRFFKQSIIAVLITGAIVFIYLQPGLALIGNRFSPYNQNGLRDVIHTNKVLSIDPNSTWRLILWNQIIVDNFPNNIFGYGFGTPMLKYYPIEDYKKLATLPYVMGAHNSFIYLFGRLGIIYLLLILPVYVTLFIEYFYYKQYYYSNNQILIFWSFFVVTVMALFNPTLESPLFASGYWMLLGFVARCIYNRKQSAEKPAISL